MTDPSLALQGAVVTALKASAALTAIVGAKVYDRVPDGTAAPYVKLSGFELINEDGECLDAAEVFFDVHCFSTGQGRPQAAMMASAVSIALDQTRPALSGFSEAEIRHRTTRYLTESDGLTERAILNFQALIDKA